MIAGDRCIDVDDQLSKPERSTHLAACLVVALSLLLTATGPAWAGFDDGMAAAKRGRVAARLTPEQLTEAQRLAQEWRPEAP